MHKMRTNSILYVVGAVLLYLVYWFFIYKNHFLNIYLDFVIQALYWIVTCVLMNLINHGYIWQGIKSFFKVQQVIDSIIKDSDKKKH